MKKELSAKLRKQIEGIKAIRDEDIDTSDIPEITDWRGAVRGKFYRPVKKPVTVRVDADVLAWLKSSGKGYQTKINKLLRDAMTQSTKIRKRA